MTAMVAPVDAPPLVVDLERALLRNDLALETKLATLRAAARGMFDGDDDQCLDHQADHGALDVTVLPYDEAVLAWIAGARSTGQRVELVTSGPAAVADRIAAHLGLFDRVTVISPDSASGPDARRVTLVRTYGERGFDYAGHTDESAVLAAARRAYVVGAAPDALAAIDARGGVLAAVAARRARPADWLAALRLHQWLKNLLVFAPLFAAHREHERALLFASLGAFLAFGLCASSVYLLNDLFDLDDDRHHPRKRMRPLAAGRVSLRVALWTIPVLLFAAFASATWVLPAAFAGVLAIYYLLTLAYSLWLKRRTIVDVMTLAMLYTLRVIAGAAVTGIVLSFWLLAFSMFMFLSLALVKRYAEINQLRARAATSAARGRGYYGDDAPMVAALGAAAGYMAVLVLALYINDIHTTRLYRHPEFIWAACPLVLTWVSRVWMQAHRGLMHDDPVVFATRDRLSLALAALTALVFWAAT